MAAPTISAAQAVGEYLQSPDDLMKIPAFRKSSRKRKHPSTFASREA